jgi:hypothetical protein
MHVDDCDCVGELKIQREQQRQFKTRAWKMKEVRIKAILAAYRMR